MDTIFFEKMAFYGYHGVFAEENKLGQRFLVDLELGIDLRAAAEADDLKQTIDYAKVYSVVKEEVEENPVDLVETVAERIASQLFAAFPIEEVSVRLTKPDPPIPGHYQAVGVQIYRRRSERPDR
ncbi:dihydroneopterin aldolase [Mechercharimyces sp. CAU 1602]|uniref:dihydroneopterin aldolase n=1 Tax=Mechercharimyces sp. CAU 1602 TaxID=2973933 RepID=UPI0021629725|nr:dihydroneopterin aldolase [Mechercharimyces sp. CAU 1602]MCS1352403.1 dihydroneopterin aldolase [Mechercharimyces sp. CAU 1602]